MCPSSISGINAFTLNPQRSDHHLNHHHPPTPPRQNPLLFNGSMRYNLDPFDQHDDQTLWTVLEQIRLDSFVRQLPDKLRAHVDDEGANIR